jgi:hypothetical protein
MKGNRMTPKMFPLALALLVAPGIPSAFAQNARGVATPPSVSAIASSPEQATKTRDEQQSRAWNLTGTEWARYRELMAGPLGIYSPNLDPLSALDIDYGPSVLFLKKSSQFARDG